MEKREKEKKGGKQWGKKVREKGEKKERGGERGKKV